MFLISNLGVGVDTPEGSVVWSASPNQEQFTTFTAFGSVVLELDLIDSITFTALEDKIFADRDVLGPGRPNQDHFFSPLQQGDQAFLDVLLLF